MSQTKRYTPIILLVASAVGIGWLFRHRRQGTAGLRDWRPVLARRHGVKKAHQLSVAVNHQYSILIAETSLPENQALCWHLKEKILPGLALYRVLLKEHDSNQSAALAEVDEAFRNQTLAKSRLLLAPFRLLTAPFRLLKLVFPILMNQFPAEGWDIAYVENSNHKVAFNITRCFYLNTLTAYGAPELTASFCKGDDVMAECFPPSICFVRLYTLGRGDAMCDFQYSRGQMA